MGLPAMKGTPIARRWLIGVFVVTMSEAGTVRIDRELLSRRGNDICSWGSEVIVSETAIGAEHDFLTLLDAQ